MTTNTNMLQLAEPEHMHLTKKSLLAAARWFCNAEGRYTDDDDRLLRIIQILEGLEEQTYSAADVKGITNS